MKFEKKKKKEKISGICSGKVTEAKMAETFTIKAILTVITSIHSKKSTTTRKKTPDIIKIACLVRSYIQKRLSIFLK